MASPTFADLRRLLESRSKLVAARKAWEQEEGRAVAQGATDEDILAIVEFIDRAAGR